METVIEVPYAAGHARNKMVHAQVVEKFRYCVERRLSSTRAEEIITAIDNLDRLASTRELMRLLV
jgi:2-methylcitrate dehydratase PrpD